MIRKIPEFSEAGLFHSSLFLEKKSVRSNQNNFYRKLCKKSFYLNFWTLEGKKFRIQGIKIPMVQIPITGISGFSRFFRGFHITIRIPGIFQSGFYRDFQISIPISRICGIWSRFSYPDSGITGFFDQAQNKNSDSKKSHPEAKSGPDV